MRLQSTSGRGSRKEFPIKRLISQSEPADCSTLKSSQNYRQLGNWKHSAAG